MANYVYYNGIIVESGTTFGGGGGGGGGIAGNVIIEYKLNGVTTEVAEDTVTPANTKPLPVKITNPASSSSLAVQDFLDVGLFDASITTIPRSSLNAVQVVSSLSATINKIQIIEDIGEFMALYSNATRTNLLCFLPLGGGEVEVSINAGVPIFIGHLKDTNIVSGNIAINFLG